MTSNNGKRTTEINNSNKTIRKEQQEENNGKRTIRKG
jgi:hypothetical protein